MIGEVGEDSMLTDIILLNYIVEYYVFQLVLFFVSVEMVACAHVFCCGFAGVFVVVLWFGVGCMFCVVWLVCVRGLWLYDFDFLDVVYSVVFEES